MLIDLAQTLLQAVLQFGQVLANRLREASEAGLLNEPVLVLPRVIIDQVVLATPQADAMAAEHVAGFETVAQQTVDHKLIAIRQEVSLSARTIGIQIRRDGVRDTTLGEGLRGILAK